MMEFDTSVHTEDAAKYNLKLIQKFSGFNKYFIGSLFPNNGTATQICIWNLDKYGTEYSLEWTDNTKNVLPEGGDILIRNKRIRTRPGQISTKVPLDYSLRSYSEVIFLEPRMKIYVQGSVVFLCSLHLFVAFFLFFIFYFLFFIFYFLFFIFYFLIYLHDDYVKTRPLAKSLNKTTYIKGDVLGKPVELILGRSQLEWEQMNCGIFLYWHVRLIEAYKRVGGMVHNADMGRGVLGVIQRGFNRTSS